MQSHPNIAAVALTLALGVTGCDRRPETGHPHPNVVLISLDTLRADHLGCYGYGRPTTPVIDRLYPLEQAAEAMAYSESGRARGKIILTTR